MKWYWQDETPAVKLKPILVACFSGRLCVVRITYRKPDVMEVWGADNKGTEEFLPITEIRVWAYCKHVPKTKDPSKWQQRVEKQKEARRTLEKAGYDPFAPKPPSVGLYRIKVAVDDDPTSKA